MAIEARRGSAPGRARRAGLAAALLLGVATGQRGRPTAPGPAFPATYQLNRSTIIQVCNYSGLTDPASVRGWGIVDFVRAPHIAVSFAQVLAPLRRSV